MITGIVNPQHEATIRVSVHDSAGQELEFDTVLDTGFSGSLTLPPSTIDTLDLPFRSRARAILADSSEIEFDLHTATIIWDGEPRNILVEAADTDPLVGMGLLYGYEIHIEAVDGGSVTIESLIR